MPHLVIASDFDVPAVYPKVAVGTKKDNAVPDYPPGSIQLYPLELPLLTPQSGLGTLEGG